jgi:branched-chain amino acid transport system substrate-binding protein
MHQATPKGITRKAFLTSAAAGTAAFALRPPLLWGKDTPLKLGAQLCMTGGLAPNGVWGSRAVEAAVKKINQAGGIKGRKVEYVLEDTETNVQTGIRKMRKLIEQDQVDFIVGSVHSGINPTTLLNGVAHEGVFSCARDRHGADAVACPR